MDVLREKVMRGEGMTEEQRLREQAVARRLWESFSPEQKKTVTKVINKYNAEVWTHLRLSITRK